MKKYEAPELEMLKFVPQDNMTVSGGNGDDDYTSGDDEFE